MGRQRVESLAGFGDHQRLRLQAASLTLRCCSCAQSTAIHSTSRSERNGRRKAGQVAPALLEQPRIEAEIRSSHMAMLEWNTFASSSKSGLAKLPSLAPTRSRAIKR